MLQKLAIIHTTPVTVAPKALTAELLPGVAVVNFGDDSVLPQPAENGGKVAEVARRLVQYGVAEEVGAHAVLSACSSVGEVAAEMALQEKFLTSPRLGMVRVRDVLAAGRA